MQVWSLEVSSLYTRIDLCMGLKREILARNGRNVQVLAEEPSTDMSVNLASQQDSKTMPLAACGGGSQLRIMPASQRTGCAQKNMRFGSANIFSKVFRTAPTRCQHFSRLSLHSLVGLS